MGGGKEASVAVPVLFDDRAEWWEPKEVGLSLWPSHRLAIVVPDTLRSLTVDL